MTRQERYGGQARTRQYGKDCRLEVGHVADIAIESTAINSLNSFCCLILGRVGSRVLAKYEPAIWALQSIYSASCHTMWEGDFMYIGGSLVASGTGWPPVAVAQFLVV